MSRYTLDDLQASVVDKTAFTTLDNYLQLATAFLEYVKDTRPTEIVSPTQQNYFFLQYAKAHGSKITRPLNGNLFIRSIPALMDAYGRLTQLLADLKREQERVSDREAVQKYLATNEINCVVYTLQQSIGCIGDSFGEANQSRKRVGQLFETLVKLMIREVGLVCEPRTVQIPIPANAGMEMKYELDVVFSRNKAIIAAESVAGTLEPDPESEAPAIEPVEPTPASRVEFIADNEIVGSVKTTSKDRIDKVFLDKFLLGRLLGRDIPVVAVFLHDVQRARAGRGAGASIFSVNSTFKTGHFLGYTVALSRLDGVYYVDPRPEMRSNPQLNALIGDFQQFLVHDLWVLSA